MLNIVMLCCMIAVPHKIEAPKPNHRPLYLAIMQAGAVTADAITTSQFEKRGYIEKDPLVRSILGPRPNYAQMIPLGAAEVLGSYLLARKWHKLEWLQISLIVTHSACAFHNSRLP